jgi:dihydrodipicolinate synthase/N-acetylneuraminate lyase
MCRRLGQHSHGDAMLAQPMATLLAACITPLADGGERLDEDAIGPVVAHLHASGVDGVFACGTTGEGVLLRMEERRRAMERFREACDGTLIAHCGAQTTADTTALAAHAAEIGADGAAVIPPPYYPLDAAALVEHFRAAAAACAPLPFYLYAFTARSGYALPTAVVQQVAEAAPNVAGLKVSEAPFEVLEPYLELGLPVFVGSEPLLPQAMRRGAAGSVSGLASAFPREIRALLEDPDEAAVARVRELRQVLEGPIFTPALKHVLGLRGLPVSADVRRPLRPLTQEEQRAVESVAAPAEVA